MKKLIVMAVTVALALPAAMAQNSPAANAPATTQTSGAQIVFDQPKFNFGTVTEGTKVENTFTFKNNGTEPLILANVQTTCGCTVPEWPKEPILPGKTGAIKATFNTTGKGGQQNKVITIISNAKEGNTTVALLGTVSKAGAQAPAATPAQHNHAH